MATHLSTCGYWRYEDIEINWNIKLGVDFEKKIFLEELYSLGVDIHMVKKTNEYDHGFPGNGGTPRKVGWGLAAHFPKPSPYL